MNVICLTGNVTKEPKMIQTERGTPVCKVTIAAEEFYIMNATKMKRAYVDCIGYGSAATYLSRCSKGDLLEVIGSIATFSKKGNWHMDVQISSAKNHGKRAGQEQKIKEINIDDVDENGEIIDQEPFLDREVSY